MIKKFPNLTIALVTLILLFIIGATGGYIDRTDIKDDAIGSEEIGDLEYLQWNLSPSVTPGEGLLWWNDIDGTLNLGMPGGNVNLQIGQEQHFRAKNTSGGTITNGMAVYISGSTGAFPEIGKAAASNHIVANSTIAVATEDIANNQFGYVTTFGLVRDVDTSWAIADGTPGFLSTTPGVIASALPTQPDSQVFMAVVIKKHASEGILFVKVIGQPNLEELSDMLVISIADANLLVWDDANSVWINTNTITQTVDNSGSALTVQRDKPSADTNGPVVFIHQDNGGDDQVALGIQSDAGGGIDVVAGALGTAITAEGNADGIRSTTSGSSTFYGGSFDRTKIDTYSDHAEVATPATPSAGLVRGPYAKTDKNLYQKDSTGLETRLNYTQVSMSHSIDAYINVATKRQDVNLHGGLVQIANAQALSVFPPLNLTTGLGKLIFVVNAGGDLVGDITITGISVDRDTGAETGADTEIISINGGTIDGSSTDSGGNIVHLWDNAYISSKWWRDGVVLSTADVTITDMDVWHCSFEQFNDQSGITVQTLDINAFALATAAELYAHLYYVNPGAGDTVAVSSISDIEYVAAASAANRYARLRRGNIGQAVDGSTEGIFLDVFFERFANADWEDITIKIWYDMLKDLQ